MLQLIWVEPGLCFAKFCQSKVGDVVVNSISPDRMLGQIYHAKKHVW
jgi:hypothetical protein